MKKAGLLGYPLGHTMSPQLHRKLCRFMGEEIEYEKFEIPAENLAEETSKADILVAAVGKADFVTADMVKEGATVIDVGIPRVPSSETKSGFRLVGDVDYAEVAPKCSFITPVPGGVGPMTIVSLLQNTLKAYRFRTEG